MLLYELFETKKKAKEKPKSKLKKKLKVKHTRNHKHVPVITPPELPKKAILLKPKRSHKK